jgi:hypothetical protein
MLSRVYHPVPRIMLLYLDREMVQQLYGTYPDAYLCASLEAMRDQ